MHKLYLKNFITPITVGELLFVGDVPVKVVAMYEHTGRILVRDMRPESPRNFGVDVEEIGAEWRGMPPKRFRDPAYIGRMPALDPRMSAHAKFSMTGRLPSAPEMQTLHSRKELPNSYSQALGADFAALELRIAAASYVIPIDAADRQRLLDGLDALLSLDTLAGQPGRDAEQAAIKELADHLRKV